jgi:hypothetical protein
LRRSTSVTSTARVLAELARRVQPGEAAADDDDAMFGEAGLVPAVAGKDHVHVGRVFVEHVPLHHGHAPPVGARVEIDRGGGEGIDVGRGRLQRARVHCRHCAEPGAGGHVEDSATGDRIRVLVQVSPDRKPARPREGPIGECRIIVPCLQLNGVPERQHLIGHVEADLLEPGHGPQGRVAKDEGAGGSSHAATLPAHRRKAT